MSHDNWLKEQTDVSGTLMRSGLKEESSKLRSFVDENPQFKIRQKARNRNKESPM